MNKQTEALKMAIEALERIIISTPAHQKMYDKAIQACKEALEPDRTGMVYYKNNACKAKDANSPDCICWTPEQPAQEPVAWMYRVNNTYTQFDTEKPPSDSYDDGTLIPLYTHPAPQPAQKVKVLYEKDGIQTCEILPAPSWKGLSDDEIYTMRDANTQFYFGENHTDELRFARAIENALKEKNHG